ncbi:hypothetical protein ACWV95_03950 [Streptomyces albus]
MCQALTATYEAGLGLCSAAKTLNGRIVTIFGNDHVTALTRECLSSQSGVIDYAFVGNEVVGSFVNLITALSVGADIDAQSLPGLSRRDGPHTAATPQQPEPLYTQIDRVFQHSTLYQENFSRRIVPTFARETGRQVHRGMPVEIGRGCIKFARNDACSFCSIQFGGMWRMPCPPRKRHGRWSMPRTGAATTTCT